MMEMEKIIIRISPEGEIQIEGVGFQGNACDAALDPYSRALGVTRETRHKPEYYRAPRRGEEVRLGGE